MRYVKRPIVVEAEPVESILSFFNDRSQSTQYWASNALNDGTLVPIDDTILVATLEGTVLATCEDMIIKGIRGELYPCKIDIFLETYDSCDDAV